MFGAVTLLMFVVMQHEDPENFPFWEKLPKCGKVIVRLLVFLLWPVYLVLHFMVLIVCMIIGVTYLLFKEL